MSTAIAPLVDGYFRKNRDLVEWTEQVFAEFCSHPQSRVPFFNTLSYMEHIGSYKIMATQSGEAMDYATLKHLNEEAGHAVLFKRHAERFGDGLLDYCDTQLIAPASARAYFSRLEIAMMRLFGSRSNYRTIYLYMSLIVEFRAVWAYPILQDCLRKCQLDVSLDKLLAEEQGHLHSMIRRLDADGLFSLEWIQSLWEDERKLFIRLMRAISRRVEFIADQENTAPSIVATLP